MPTALLVLAAGRSRRLGRPKQLLPFRGRPLLDAVLAVARACPGDQRLVALGGAANDVQDAVDLAGFEVVVNEAYGTGCSSSIAAAVPELAPGTDVVVLLLGDQPCVTTDAVRRLLGGWCRTAVSGVPAAGPRWGDLGLAVERFEPRRTVEK